MKNALRLYLNRTLYILILALALFPQCKKDEKKDVIIVPSSNIVLKDKDLDTIKANINGTWKLCYEQGGYCAVCPPKRVDQVYFEFKDRDSVLWTEMNLTRADTKISWKYVKDVFEENTFLLNFFDTRSYPYSFIVDGIYNDTLLLIDNAYDPMKYYLARLNK